LKEKKRYNKIQFRISKIVFWQFDDHDVNRYTIFTFLFAFHFAYLVNLMQWRYWNMWILCVYNEITLLVFILIYGTTNTLKHYLGSCIVLGSLTNNLGTLQILLILTERNDDLLTESSDRRQLAFDIHNRLHFSITFGCIFCWSVTGSNTIF
jgi:hypothetical protein